jgi:glycosyltransferase involved in cell wall biosynthesis
MKVAVYTIVKNEEKHIARWAASARDADYLLICDTGSTDNTVRVAHELGIAVTTFLEDPFRFDSARNAALNFLPEDIDFCISLDADEVLLPGWKPALESIDPCVITRPRHRLICSRNEDGSEGLVFSGNRIHHRYGYAWKFPVHEIVSRDSSCSPEVEAWSDVVIEHLPDNSKARSYYLPMLKRFAMDEPLSDRAAFYYARELFNYGHLSDAHSEFLRYLRLESSTWGAERSAAMRSLASCAPAEKESWLLRACAEAPGFRENWVDLAAYYYSISSWSACYAAALRAISITEKPLEYLAEQYAWGFAPFDYAALASYHLGLYDETLKHSTNALSYAPTDARLRSNHDFYEQATKRLSTP